MDLRRMPKLDLHCHLDGSIDPVLIFDWLMESGDAGKLTGSLTGKRIVTGDDPDGRLSIEKVRELIEAPEKCGSLMEYLCCFDLPLEYVQYGENLENSAYTLVMRAHAEGVVYLEARFAPGTCTRKGLATGEAIDAALRGLSRAEEECGIRTGLICCAMRHQPEGSNLEVLRESRERLGAGVAAVDLAGDELSMPNRHFRNFFEECRNMDMPFTIHSGETGSVQNVKDAIDFHAARIGHGTAMKGHPELERVFAQRRIGVEVCPTSNFQTGAAGSEENYPLREFLDMGIPVSVNTDNRTVSDTDSTHEFELCVNRLGISEEDLKRIYTDSVDMAFTDDLTRQALLDAWV